MPSISRSFLKEYVFFKDSENQYRLQKDLILKWRAKPMLGYTEAPLVESRVVASAAPNFFLQVLW